MIAPPAQFLKKFDNALESKIIKDSDAPDAPKIEFPCKNYVVKVIGENSDAFKAFALAKMFELCPLDKNEHQFAKKMKANVSGKGTFMSISFYITAEGIDHLQTVNDELKKDKRTKVVM
jgi:uncharacterized protein